MGKKYPSEKQQLNQRLFPLPRELIKSCVAETKPTNPFAQIRTVCAHASVCLYQLRYNRLRYVARFHLPHAFSPGNPPLSTNALYMRCSNSNQLSDIYFQAFFFHSLSLLCWVVNTITLHFNMCIFIDISCFPSKPMSQLELTSSWFSEIIFSSSHSVMCFCTMCAEMYQRVL